jgi:glycosyltransferase involved in cell wall biosynthesis
MASPELSIVIITLNEQENLPRLLRDLAAQTWRDFEIIHVDSASTDKTLTLSRQLSQQFDHYQIVPMLKRGVSLGRNVGADHANGRRLLFLDADTRFEPEFLEQALTDLDRRALEVGIVCMSGDRSDLRQRLGYGLFNLGIKATSYVFPTAIGACLFSTQDIHHRIGGFDERLSLCEDCNYALKAKRAEPRAVAVITPRFHFDPRRLKQDGFVSTGLIYLRANLRRFFVGELYKQEIPYEFGHYM